MPDGGVYCAGRWSDVELYGAPSQATDMRQPVPYGERWEDPVGQFATAKCSASEEAAIGRYLAKYRRRVVDDQRGRGIFDVMKGWFSGPPDLGEPELFEGRIPPDVSERLYCISVPRRKGVLFIDLMSPDTLEALDALIGPSVRAATGAEFPGEDLARHPDRRVTRLVMRTLYSWYAGSEVAGIRYPGHPDSDWEAFVIWTPPLVIPLGGRDVGFRWVARWDDDLLAAAKTLGLRLP